MKTFLKKISIIILVTVLLIAVSSHLIYWHIQKKQVNYLKYESGLIYTQYKHLDNKQYNTMFLGTSKMYRQVDPLVIDSIVANTKSINMGVNNLYPFRSFDFERFISPKCDSIKTILYEIRTPGLIGKNYNSVRTLISISGKRNQQLLNYLISADYSFKLKVKSIINYLKMFLYKSFGIGLRRLIEMEEPQEYYEFGGPTEQGYYALEDQMKKEMEHGHNSGAVSDYNNFKDWLQSNTIANYFSINRDILLNKEFKYSAFSKITVDHLKRYFPNARIIFVIPPHTNSSFYPILFNEGRNYEKLGYSVLDYTYQDKYPQLYEDITSFDIGHLNSVGAGIYSAYLANDIKLLNY